MKVTLFLPSVVGYICGWTLLRLLGVLAESDVHVALKASFDAPPYLLELLETAAAENQTAYFPLLDRIADGYFSTAITDQELYDRFLLLMQDEGHISEPDTFTSFLFALSIHAAAPRIEAHHQFYKQSIEPALPRGGECSTWVHFAGKRYCSPLLDESQGDVAGQKLAERQLDRILSIKAGLPPAILYADLTDPAFGHFHQILSESAKKGKTSYRVRYVPSKTRRSQPLLVNGYGVELALKRTDYIVIDDRDADPATAGQPVQVEDGANEAKQDLKPLSKSELSRLGLKTASYVMSSDDPFKTILQISQDFPKYSSMIAAHDVSESLLEELRDDRTTTLPPGYNGLWMNGLPISVREMDAHTLLHHLRVEKNLIRRFSSLGLSTLEARNLLLSSSVVQAGPNTEPQRYDYRDETEGGNVIIWLNDIESDSRYKRWPTSANALLQRTYPGQLPSVRRDIHNLVVTVDLSNLEDISVVVNELQNFVKRAIPIRFGVVPTVENTAARDQARVVYYLSDAYGLSSVISYLETCYRKKGCGKADPSAFNNAVEGRKHRSNQEVLSLPELFKHDALEVRLDNARMYAKRLAIGSTPSPVLVNGAVLPRNEDWLQAVINRVNIDLRIIQQGIIDERLGDETWLPSQFLAKAVHKRNTLVIPEDEDLTEFFDLSKLSAKQLEIYHDLPRWKGDNSVTKDMWAQLIIIGDMSFLEIQIILKEALHVRQDDPGLEIVVLHNPAKDSKPTRVFQILQDQMSKLGAPSTQPEGDATKLNSPDFWEATAGLLEILKISQGQTTLLLNGRVVGPVPAASGLDRNDIAQLLGFERTERARPINAALEKLGLADRVSDHYAWAQLISLVASSSKSSASPGALEAASRERVDFSEHWNTTHSALRVGNADNIVIYLVAVLDPASEIAQRWLPILNAVCKLQGVYLKLILNPRDNLQELPIKRFYRYVLQSEPLFNADGSVKGLSAQFEDLPRDALLTVGLDVPSSWLVAPKESVHDLDNIKLNTLKDVQEVYALYELEHILIEGHSRDTTTGSAPRGAQLVLGTPQKAHTMDTIIMANLGYFQFKANPGVWEMDLLSGKSQDLYSFDSPGSKGPRPQPGDESRQIEVLDFQGKTLFPRLSRKPGREMDDVLETFIDQPDAPLSYFSRVLKLAGNLLSGVGLARDSQQADINIFSVASGHLYERMLNIMMISVMKHTQYSVKFWFIEQFLSPSFKDSIPHLAAEYGFNYEMVTYKWPHWLRAQREKQREIWGYKILFLDVLFPLSLNKVIFVDADQIVRTDMYDLVRHDLGGAVYGFTPMGDSRSEMEGFRFWKQGYWKTYLRGLPYHISALYVVDLHKFRQVAAGDRLRQQYQQLSADPNSLSNLDQDLPNHMQHTLPIHSLPQEWLWCETWCSDEDLATARTIDLCNNPMTKEPKLDRARRQVPEWTVYDDEIREVIRRRSREGSALRGKHSIATGSSDLHSSSLRESVTTSSAAKDEL